MTRLATLLIFAAAASAAAADGPKTKAQVQALIDKVGRTPPEWFDETPLEFPKSLDLSWPEKPGEGWNNQKNVGQYVWDIINPNQNKWREGVRLMHHLLSLHKDDKAKRERIMDALARMYHNLLEDYARAAFWWQQAGVGKGSKFDRTSSGAHLAECYWRLGCKPMAVEALAKFPPTYATIKLWGDMGETQRSVQLATRSMKNARWPAELHLMIGDAYRVAGKEDLALKAYEQALAEAQQPDHVREEKFRVRAAASVSAMKLAKALDLKRIPDGTYASQSIGYEGPVHVAVTVKDHTIAAVRVTEHKEKQYYAALTDTPAKIIAKQSVKGVDATSSATITSEAIINATAKALAEQNEK